MATSSKIQYGDNLKVTDMGGGVIRVDSVGGAAGPAGPQGPQGLAGPAGSPAPTFIFTQGSASAVWSVTHNLAMYPSVTVVDTGGTELWPTVVYVDANHVTLTFASPTSGKAYLN